MKNVAPDIAYDREALRPLLQTVIGNLSKRNITERNWYEHYSSACDDEYEFKYESEIRRCKMYVIHYDEQGYELHFKCTQWDVRSNDYIICKSPKLNDVLEKLKDRNLVDLLYKRVYFLLEGVVAESVVIDEGFTHIAPMLLDLDGSKKDNGDKTFKEEFPLYKYDRIDTLIIPSSIDIPHSEMNSVFADMEQRDSVSNWPTKCKRIHISKIENHSPNLLVEDGVLYSMDKSRLIYCFEDKSSFVVPQSVTTIEPFAFCLQKKLEKIVLHDGIASIGTSAFLACSSLKDIVIPKKIKRITWGCFDGCTSLCNVLLPEGLESISHYAFGRCKSLQEIKLPSTLKEIDGFEGCSSLKEIEIPSGVERIDGFMFCESLKKVVLNQGVKSIADYAFRFCNSLSKINFPDGLKNIGPRAFYPSSLKRLSFPTSLREIGSEAFYHNNKLIYVKFRSNVNIDQAAFACCPLLFRQCVHKPVTMQIKDNVFIYDSGLDKFGFWD